MQYEQLLKDLTVCATAETCTGCSRNENQKEVPECYHRVMEEAKEALEERIRTVNELIGIKEDLEDALREARLAGIDGIRAILKLVKEVL